MATIRNLYEDGSVINYVEGDSSLERTPRDFPDDDGDESHTVMEEDTLTYIAHLFYKDSRKWWIIADKNQLDDIFNLELGSELIIPNPKLL